MQGWHQNRTNVPNSSTISLKLPTSSWCVSISGGLVSSTKKKSTPARTKGAHTYCKTEQRSQSEQRTQKTLCKPELRLSPAKTQPEDAPPVQPNSSTTWQSQECFTHVRRQQQQQQSLETIELENLTDQAAQCLHSGEERHESQGTHAQELAES